MKNLSINPTENINFADSIKDFGRNHLLTTQNLICVLLTYALYKFFASPHTLTDYAPRAVFIIALYVSSLFTFLFLAFVQNSTGKVKGVLRLAVLQLVLATVQIVAYPALPFPFLAKVTLFVCTSFLGLRLLFSIAKSVN